MTRYSLTRGRRSRKRLARFCAEHSSNEYTLVVHSLDVDHGVFFPNSFIVGARDDRAADLHTDPGFHDLVFLGDGSFDLAVCTGLLEHVPDPPRLIGELHRILRPGGRLILSASAVFPFHGSPDNYFHFTPNGFKLLFAEWSGFKELRGSTQPFETIAILLQRINLQCDVFPPVRPLIELLYHTVPLMDVFVLRQYDTNAHRERSALTDAMMPVTLHAVIIK